MLGTEGLPAAAGGKGNEKEKGLLVNFRPESLPTVSENEILGS